MPIASHGALPFFSLPTELRLAIYDHLQFPPVDNFECIGLILSCWQGKKEAEEAALKNAKLYLAHQKDYLRSEAPFDIQILITPPSPISPRGKFNTIREITIVLPASEYTSIHTRNFKFYRALELLSPLLMLWLNKLTLHFRRNDERHNIPEVVGHPVRAFYQLLVFLHHCFEFGHDESGTVKATSMSGFKGYADKWNIPPVFMRRIAISWDFTEHGLKREDMVEMKGSVKRRPTNDCGGPPAYRVSSDDRRVGEVGVRSGNRFRYDERTAWHARSPEGHKEICLVCKSPTPYVRYARGLPILGGEGWV